MRVLVFIFLLAVSVPSFAISNDWFDKALVQKSPDQLLYYTTAIDECGLSKDSLQSVVEGVLTRSRIKPIPFKGQPGLVLDVRLDCRELSNGWVVFYSIYFGRTDEQSVLYDKNYGRLGTAPPDGLNNFLNQNVKSGIERAMTDYLRVNFNL